MSMKMASSMAYAAVATQEMPGIKKQQRRRSQRDRQDNEELEGWENYRRFNPELFMQKVSVVIGTLGTVVVNSLAMAMF